VSKPSAPTVHLSGAMHQEALIELLSESSAGG
jgi:hypothetical protein